MRVVGVLLALCGCNQIFGIRETQQTDAAFFDAPADAPPSCPPIGTVPRFGKLLHQAVTQECLFYTTSREGNIAAADCGRPQVDPLISDGTVDGELSLSTLTPPVVMPPPPVPDQFGMPRLTPEGDELWMRRKRYTGTAILSVFHRDGLHAWTWSRDVQITTMSRDDTFSAPTRSDPGGRRVLDWSASEFKLYEYADDGTNATVVHAYDQASLGVEYVQFPNLSADGLRLVFLGTPLADSTLVTAMYADRASIDDLFSPAVEIPSAPVVYDPFLTEDCSRLYTSGLGSIFYAQQL